MWFLKLVVLPPAYFICAWHDLHQRFSIPPCIFCMSLFNTPDSDNQLVRSSLRAWTVFRLTCSLHRVHCSLLPEQGTYVVVYFTSEHSFMVCAAQRLHARTSVTSYTSVNIYNLHSLLANLYALWMEYVCFRTGIMAECPVMSTSQGTYVQIEQTTVVIRVTYEMCRAGGHEEWNWEPLIYTQRVFRSCLPGCS